MKDISRKIAQDLFSLGVREGDTLLVHSSLRSLGKVDAKDVIDGLLLALGDEGTLVLPALSYMHCNPSKPCFDYYDTPSNVGALAEYFRTSVDGVVRSINPTHSCCAQGKHADFVTSGHILDNTPCGKNSPFRRVYELGGRILFIGCGMEPNTSMHAVEELSVPDYLFGEEYSYSMTDRDGKTQTSTCFAHDFKNVYQRYDRLESLMPVGEMTKGKVLDADCHLINCRSMWHVADSKYCEDPHYFIDKG